MIAAVCLLLPWTATVGAVIFFPIILNIFVITVSIGFQGTVYITGLMLLATIWLLCWDYPKLKAILPKRSVDSNFPKREYTVQMFGWAVVSAGFYALLFWLNIVNVRTDLGIWGFVLAAVAGAIFGLLIAWHLLRLPARDSE